MVMSTVLRDRVFDQQVLDEMLKLDKSGSIVKKLVAFFVESIPSGILKCKNAVKKNNYKKLKELAHYHRSTCHNVGATQLGDYFYQLEIHSHAGNGADLEKLVSSLEPIFKESLNEVGLYVKKLN